MVTDAPLRDVSAVLAEEFGFRVLTDAPLDEELSIRQHGCELHELVERLLSRHSYVLEYAAGSNSAPPSSPNRLIVFGSA